MGNLDLRIVSIILKMVVTRLFKKDLGEANVVILTLVRLLGRELGRTAESKKAESKAGSKSSPRLISARLIGLFAELAHAVRTGQQNGSVVPGRTLAAETLEAITELAPEVQVRVTLRSCDRSLTRSI